VQHTDGGEDALLRFVGMSESFSKYCIAITQKAPDSRLILFAMAP